MPSSGKTTLGKILSNKLNYEFIDTDKLIEKLEGISIEAIFKTYGESYFREKEKQAINFIKDTNNTIVATGGGLPIYNNNIERLKNIGFTVFLEVDLHNLYERNLNSEVKRPLLEKDEMNSLNRLYGEREKIYKKAHSIVNNDSVEENTIDEIIKVYKNFNSVL